MTRAQFLAGATSRRLRYLVRPKATPRNPLSHLPWPAPPARRTASAPSRPESGLAPSQPQSGLAPLRPHYGGAAPDQSRPESRTSFTSTGNPQLDAQIRVRLAAAAPRCTVAVRCGGPLRGVCDVTHDASRVTD